MTLLTFCSTDNQCAQRVGVHQIKVHLRSPQQGEFVRVKYGLSDFLVHSTKVDFASYSNAHEPHQNHTKPHHDHARTQVLRTILGAIPGCMHAFCMCGVQSDCSVCSRTTKQFRAVSGSTRSNGEARAQQRATAALVSSRSPDRCDVAIWAHPPPRKCTPEVLITRWRTCLRKLVYKTPLPRWALSEQLSYSQPLEPGALSPLHVASSTHLCLFLSSAAVDAQVSLILCLSLQHITWQP